MDRDPKTGRFTRGHSFYKNLARDNRGRWVTEKSEDLEFKSRYQEVSEAIDCFLEEYYAA